LKRLLADDVDLELAAQGRGGQRIDRTVDDNPRFVDQTVETPAGSQRDECACPFDVDGVRDVEMHRFAARGPVINTDRGQGA
jgi:hypothetical protein